MREGRPNILAARAFSPQSYNLLQCYIHFECSSTQGRTRGPKAMDQGEVKVEKMPLTMEATFLMDSTITAHQAAVF